jgi:hypothetical protein
VWLILPIAEGHAGWGKASSAVDILLAPEFRPIDPAGLADQEPFTAWLRRGIGRDRIFAEPQLYEPLGTAVLIREQSRQRFGRPRAAIERQRQIRF